MVAKLHLKKLTLFGFAVSTVIRETSQTANALTISLRRVVGPTARRKEILRAFAESDGDSDRDDDDYKEIGEGMWDGEIINSSEHEDLEACRDFCNETNECIAFTFIEEKETEELQLLTGECTLFKSCDGSTLIKDDSISYYDPPYRSFLHQSRFEAQRHQRSAEGDGTQSSDSDDSKDESETTLVSHTAEANQSDAEREKIMRRERRLDILRASLRDFSNIDVIASDGTLVTCGRGESPDMISMHMEILALPQSDRDSMSSEIADYSRTIINFENHFKLPYHTSPDIIFGAIQLLHSLSSEKLGSISDTLDELLAETRMCQWETHLYSLLHIAKGLPKDKKESLVLNPRSVLWGLLMHPGTEERSRIASLEIMHDVAGSLPLERMERDVRSEQIAIIANQVAVLRSSSARARLLPLSILMQLQMETLDLSDEEHGRIISSVESIDGDEDVRKVAQNVLTKLRREQSLPESTTSMLYDSFLKLLRIR